MTNTHLHKLFSKTQKGFTLIELLIVIAVLGVLATVVLVAIDPLEQLARARDAGRKSTVGQLSKATQAYYTSTGGKFFAESGTWITTNLVTAGEVKVVPADTGTATACTTNVQNDYCYDSTATTFAEALVFARLESKSEKAKCASGTNPYFLWSSVDGKTGVVCTAADPAIGGTFTFL